MLRVIVGTLLLCSLVSLGDSLDCFNAVSLEGSVNVKASMKSSDCNLLRPNGFVKTKYGTIPESIAKQANLTGEIVKFKAEEVREFLCVHLAIDASGELKEGLEGNVDMTIRCCVVNGDVAWPEPEGPTNVAEFCTALDESDEPINCRTCDTDGCNSSSSLTASLLVCLILALFTKMW